MIVLDLYAGKEGEDGLHGWSRAFAKRGHKIITLDYEKRFKATITQDIMEATAASLISACGAPPDIILASPDCSCYSVASIGVYWHGPGQPKHPKAVHAMAMLEHTVELIKAINPTFFMIENPRGMMRRMPCLYQFARRTVTYCHYEDGPEPGRLPRMKPTDLWGGFPPSLSLPEPCKNGAPCHEAAPRGARTGTQGLKNSAERAIIPERLSLAVCLAAERDLENPQPIPAVDPVRSAPEPPIIGAAQTSFTFGGGDGGL